MSCAGVTAEVSGAAQGMGSCCWEISAGFAASKSTASSKGEDKGLHWPCVGVNHYKSLIQQLYSK